MRKLILIPIFSILYLAKAIVHTIEFTIKCSKCVASNLKKILLFKISDKYLIITQLLMLFCIVIFIFQCIFPEITYIFMVQSDVWYTYLTGCFLHGSVDHLLGNLLFLALIFPIIEKRYGGFFLFLAYCITGIFGNLLFIFLNPYGVAVGASGSIYGIMMLWIFHNLINHRYILIFPALYYFLMQGVFTGQDTVLFSRIAHSAHYGAAIGAMFLFPYMIYKHCSMRSIK